MTESKKDMTELLDKVKLDVSKKEMTELLDKIKKKCLCWFVLSHAYPARRDKRRRRTEWQSRLCERVGVVMRIADLRG
jgi:hypothetical protein